MQLSDERIRNLVACGAASGISAIFNAPIAGVLFALEVILGEWSAGYLSSVVVSAVTASIVGRAYFGNVPAFRVPIYRLASPWEIPLYAVLGLLAGGLAVLFTVVFYRASDLFNRWSFPDYLKPAVGGAVVGVIGLVAPEVLGGGYETIEGAMENQLLVSTMIWLLVAQIDRHRSDARLRWLWRHLCARALYGGDVGRQLWRDRQPLLRFGDRPIRRLCPCWHGGVSCRHRSRASDRDYDDF